MPSMTKSDAFSEAISQHVVIRAVFGGLVSVLIAHVLLILRGRWERVRAPRIGKSVWITGLSRARADFVKNGRALMRTGYSKYKDSIYWIQTGDMERLVLSNKYVDELQKLPNSILESRLAVVERNLGWYNSVDIILKSAAHVHICRTQLVQDLSIYPYGFHSPLIPTVLR